VIKYLWLLLLYANFSYADNLVELYGGCSNTVVTQVINANPTNYLTLLNTLQGGDKLKLSAGVYPVGLPIHNFNASQHNCIIIEGPDVGIAEFTARSCCNTVSIKDSSYVVIRNILINGNELFVDAIKAEGNATYAHHITLEYIDIINHGVNQQAVGISTKCPAWNWVVRHNTITDSDGTSAGTGMYFGNSDGEKAFVNSLVEYNLVTNTTGYNMQIKHQNSRQTNLGAPANGTTVIRHNVFSKVQNSSTGGAARPNLLVGHYPINGVGSNDEYHIYGNFFYQNSSVSEGLFQGTGNISFYNNLLYNNYGAGAYVQAHNGSGARSVRYFHNTVVTNGTGLRISNPLSGFQQITLANAVFSPNPLVGGTQSDNFVDSFANGSIYLTNPVVTLPGMNLYPVQNQLTGSVIDVSTINSYTDWNKDFNGDVFDNSYRGAYSGSGNNTGWVLNLAIKSLAEIIFTNGFEL